MQPVPIDQLNNFFGLETPQDVKLKSSLMFQADKNKENKQEPTEQEKLEKNVSNFFGVKEEKGLCKNKN